jgi:putative endonuclease
MGIYIYMVRCPDGSYYVGSATGHDLSTRINQHNAGSYPGYALSRRPVVLVWSEYFDRITDGIAVERQIKGWSRAKKEPPGRVLMNARCPLLGVKQTGAGHSGVSPFDPKRTILTA